MKKKKKISLVILRSCAIYGIGDPHNKVISIFSKMAINGETPKLNTNSYFKRDYIHVSDVAASVIYALCKSSKGIFTYNICTGGWWSAYNIAKMIVERRPMLTPLKIPKKKTQRIGYKFSPTKAKNELGFIAKINIKKGLDNLLASL